MPWHPRRSLQQSPYLGCSRAPRVRSSSSADLSLHTKPQILPPWMGQFKRHHVTYKALALISLLQVAMFPPHSLHCALSDSVSSGVFIDTKFYLFSGRKSSGEVFRSRPLFANSKTLKSVRYFDDREHSFHCPPYSVAYSSNETAF